MSCLVVTCPGLPCFALICVMLPCSALLCIAFLWHALLCFALLCLALPSLNCITLFCFALPFFALPCLAWLSLFCLASPCLALRFFPNTIRRAGKHNQEGQPNTKPGKSKNLLKFKFPSVQNGNNIYKGETTISVFSTLVLMMEAIYFNGKFCVCNLVLFAPAVGWCYLA